MIMNDQISLFFVVVLEMFVNGLVSLPVPPFTTSKEPRRWRPKPKSVQSSSAPGDDSEAEDKADVVKVPTRRHGEDVTGLRASEREMEVETWRESVTMREGASENERERTVNQGNWRGQRM